MSIPSVCWRRFAQRTTPRRALLSLSPLLAIVTICYFVLGPGLASWEPYAPLVSDDRPAAGSSFLGSPGQGEYAPGQDEDAHHSPYSFDVAGADHPTWMATAPDSWSLARLALPGTHDSLTHRIRSPVYRCQNGGLTAHLRAGVRYLDVRTRVQVPPSTAMARTVDYDAEPWPLGVYHGNMYTGYEFSQVMETVFAFLDDYPSETVVVRLKEEGPPVYGAPDDPPGLGAEPKLERATAEEEAVSEATEADEAEEKRPWWEKVGNPSQLEPSPYEASFRRYRLQDANTAGSFAEHLYRFPNQRGDSGAETPPTRVPTMGELRGKVLLLQEFPYYPASWAEDALRLNMSSYFGLPWALSSDLLQVEDLFAVDDMAHLDEKWEAVRKNLQAAAQASRQSKGGSSAGMPLYLSHLSASVGVTPIDAAAGSANGSVQGINDRTGRWLETGSDSEQAARRRVDLDPVGIVIADFPGRQLVDAVLRRNHFPK